jgi:Leucine-rich repeat (LRR) protein
MRPGCKTRIHVACWLAALLLLALSEIGNVAAHPQDKNAQAKPLPEETVAAWTKAGAEVVWINSKPGQAGDMPAFRFQTWKEGVLSKLPAPESAFGLDLSKTEITDAGLKELAAFKNLQSLNLKNTQISGVGLKELAALKNLQRLYLGFSKVTDAGLKEIASIKSLETLGLGRCDEITDAGLKELAALKNLKSLILVGAAKVSDQGVEALQRALPDCQISRGKK